jgi:hypothetical protein
MSIPQRESVREGEVCFINRGLMTTTYPEYQTTLRQLMARATKNPTE